MKDIFWLFWSRWFDIMTPAYTPLTTLTGRENMRKRRLFSVMQLTALTITLIYIVSALITSFTHQLHFSLLQLCFLLVASWFNRYEYLKLASVTFFLGCAATTFMSAQITAHAEPLLLLWTCFLMTIFLVCLGFFVPGWVIFLSALAENAFSFWYLLVANGAQISSSLSPSELQNALMYLCILIYMSAFLGTCYTITTKRAIIRADRAVELEQAHQIISEAYTNLETAHATIQMQALTDGLTGLPNHSAIIQQIEAELQKCQVTQRNCAIIFVDVDHFKSINDTWGHAAGDTALFTVGQRLREGIRKEDFVGRYGGEEFAILLSNIEQLEAVELAERLRCFIAETPCLWQREETQSEVSIPLTGSFGIAIYPLDGLTARELLDTADAAMYIAKHNGRNRVCLPDEVDVTLVKEDKNKQAVYTEQSILQTISTMATFHDQGTQDHANRMIRLAEGTMRALGRSEEEVTMLRLAAQLHDVGKIGIPESILHKPGPLNEDEWGVMRRHPQIGQQILTQAKGQFGLVSHIVVAHHERWDGTGYPYGLARQEIPLGARILSVIDAYDAMTSSRPYREALSVDVARAELLRGSGSQFDPLVVDTFLQVLEAQEAEMSNVPTSASL